MTYKSTSKLRYALDLLSSKVRDAIEAIPEADSSKLCEIRLRRGKKLSVTALGNEYFITEDGLLKAVPDRAVTVTDEDIEFTFQTALRHSVHSFEREITRGYVTASGGNRVGFCGKAIMSSERLMSVKEISSINIRIAREIVGCSQRICDRLFSEGICSALIIGPPSSGKTTVLRDLSLRLSEQKRISLIDERGELAAAVDGIPQNNVGARTDVFSSYPKLEAIMTAVRVMSPQILICDEIGAKDELQALEYALNSGVKLIAACHASSFDELKRKPVLSKLMKSGAFDKAVILGTGAMVGMPEAFIDLKHG